MYKDEAHRATGDYAYNQAIRFLMAKNPHFRVLALTATPGNKGEAVQLLVDGLHISRIEIRDEQSLDLKPYIHKKVSKAESYSIVLLTSWLRFLSRISLKLTRNLPKSETFWSKSWR